MAITTILVHPDDRVSCAVLGNDETLNKVLIKSILRMPGPHRRIVIGDFQPYMQVYVDEDFGIEWFPSGTPRPDPGPLVLIFDGHTPVA